MRACHWNACRHHGVLLIYAVIFTSVPRHCWGRGPRSPASRSGTRFPSADHRRRAVDLQSASYFLVTSYTSASWALEMPRRASEQSVRHPSVAFLLRVAPGALLPRHACPFGNNFLIFREIGPERPVDSPASHAGGPLSCPRRRPRLSRPLPPGSPSPGSPPARRASVLLSSTTSILRGALLAITRRPRCASLPI